MSWLLNGNHWVTTSKTYIPIMESTSATVSMETWEKLHAQRSGFSQVGFYSINAIFATLKYIFAINILAQHCLISKINKFVSTVVVRNGLTIQCILFSITNTYIDHSHICLPNISIQII